MDSIGSCIKPSAGIPAGPSYKRKNPVGAKLMAKRYAECRDLWTGEPLTGADKAAWERIQLEQELDRQGKLLQKSAQREVVSIRQEREVAAAC